MKNFLVCLAIVVGLVIACVNAMDREWLMDYQAQTGNQARFATSDDECLSTEHFDEHYGVCIKMRAFTVDDNL